MRLSHRTELAYSIKDGFPKILDLIRHDELGNEIRIPIYFKKFVPNPVARWGSVVYSDGKGNEHYLSVKPCLVFTGTSNSA